MKYFLLLAIFAISFTSCETEQLENETIELKAGFEGCTWETTNATTGIVTTHRVRWQGGGVNRWYDYRTARGTTYAIMCGKNGTLTEAMEECDKNGATY